jgi:hypothetical protein
MTSKLKKSISKLLIWALIFPSAFPAFADVAYTSGAGNAAISQQFSNGVVSYNGNAPTQNGLCLETVASGTQAQWGTCAAGASAVYSVTTSVSTSGVTSTATNPSQGVYNVAIGLTKVPIALGGTNAVSFVAPISGINPVVFYDGTQLNTDPAQTHFGYDSANDIVYLSSLKIAAPSTTVATFTNTGAQSPTGGAGMLAYADPTSAVQSGNRLGFMLFGGAVDASHTTVNSSGFAGFAAENWSATNQGSSLSVYTTPNGSTTSARRVVATFGNDGSTSFTGLMMSTHSGDQFQFTGSDASLYREGSWGFASGVAYSLPGSLGQYYWTHNTALNSSTGNFLGTDDTGTATYGVFSESDHYQIFHAPSVTAGTVPTFAASAVYDLDTATGNESISGVMTANSNAIAATGRAYNSTSSASSVTINQSIASTFIATPSSVAATITLAAPSKDGERRRICFGGSVTTITWAVTSPATAVIGMPTTVISGQCIEAIYNSVAGTPTNSPATTWVLY